MFLFCIRNDTSNKIVQHSPVLSAALLVFPTQYPCRNNDHANLIMHQSITMHMLDPLSSYKISLFQIIEDKPKLRLFLDNLKTLVSYSKMISSWYGGKMLPFSPHIMQWIDLCHGSILCVASSGAYLIKSDKNLVKTLFIK